MNNPMNPINQGRHIPVQNPMSSTAFNRPFSSYFMPNASYLKDDQQSMDNNSYGQQYAMQGGMATRGKSAFWPRKRPAATKVVPVRCDICEVECTSKANFDFHIQGKRHTKTLNKIQGVTTAASPKPKTITVDVLKSQYFCSECDINCSAEDQYNMHLAGIRHMKKLKMIKYEELKTNKDPSVYCEVCEIFLMQDLMTKHKESGKHKRKNPIKSDNSPRKKMKMVQPGIPTTIEYCGYCYLSLINTEEAIDHYQSSKHLSNLQNRTKNFELWCDLCQTSFHSQEILDKHLNGFKHYTKLNKGNQNPEGELGAKLLNHRLKMLALKNKKKTEIKKDKTENGEAEIDGQTSTISNDTVLDTTTPTMIA